MASDLTVGLAVGFGVGVPILVVAAILTWISIRHNRKMKEEDARLEKIDFNGEVTFYDTERQPDTSVAAAYTSFETNSTSELGSTSVLKSLGTASVDSRPISSSTHLVLDEPFSEPLRLYTPSIDSTKDKGKLSRQLNHVYGPSPAYPSSERLNSSNSLNSPRSSRVNSGPFATPPRHKNGERSIGGDSDLFPVPFEVTHPYREIVGEPPVERSTPKHTANVQEKEREKGNHYLRQTIDEN